MKFPDKCPKCGKDNVPNLVIERNEYVAGPCLDVEVHRCIHCNEPIILVGTVINEEGYNSYDLTQVAKSEDYIFCYPTSNQTNMPERVQKLSPKANEIYLQVIKAQEVGADALVRGGMRIVLEYLLYDYLVSVKNWDCKKAHDMDLFTRCNEYCKDKKDDKYFQGFADTCTRLVRLVGNELIHDKQPLPFDNKEVLETFIAFCNFLDLELHMASIGQRLPSKPTNS